MMNFKVSSSVSFRFDTRNVTAREPRLLFHSHGYGEHLVPYYNQLAEAAAARGFLTFGHDHLGHGYR